MNSCGGNGGSKKSVSFGGISSLKFGGFNGGTGGCGGGANGSRLKSGKLIGGF